MILLPLFVWKSKQKQKINWKQIIKKNTSQLDQQPTLFQNPNQVLKFLSLIPVDLFIIFYFRFPVSQFLQHQIKLTRTNHQPRKWKHDVTSRF